MITIINGDSLTELAKLPEESVNCCVTSPPYWGLRDYGVEGQIGLESTLDEFISKMVGIFREVRRVLRDDGTLWLNIGDSYNAAGRTGHGTREGCKQGTNRASANKTDNNRTTDPRLKPKDLIDVPWRVAFALQSDGWYLRQDIIWHKPNPMPESVTDRCTKAHEYVFLLSKSETYYYDQESIKEKSSLNTHERGVPCTPKANKVPTGWDTGKGNHNSLIGIYPKNKNNKSFDAAMNTMPENRNKRSVWTVQTKGYTGAHMVLAGCPIGGTVLDPFAGSGTTLQVSQYLGRKSIGIELNKKYCDLIRERTLQTAMVLE